MATTAIRRTAMERAGATKEKKYHIHKDADGRTWMIRKDGEYGDDFPKFSTLEEAIIEARKMMQLKNIFKLTIHLDKKVIHFKEQKIKPTTPFLKSKQSTTNNKLRKKPSIGTPNKEIFIPKIPGRIAIMNLCI